MEALSAGHWVACLVAMKVANTGKLMVVHWVGLRELTMAVYLAALTAVRKERMKVAQKAVHWVGQKESTMVGYSDDYLAAMKERMTVVLRVDRWDGLTADY